MFPLIVTAVTSNFGGDPVTTSQGATLRLNPATGDWFLTIAAAGVSDVPFPIEGLWGEVGQLDHALYGIWALGVVPSLRPERLSTAAWVGGHATSHGDVPASGGAHYSGDVFGIANAAMCPQCMMEGPIVLGDVHLSADFAARSVSGAMTKMIVMPGDMPLAAAPMNDISFTAGFDASRNLFTGTTHITSNPGGPATLDHNAIGAVTGQFFGPSANEVGAVWTIDDGVRRAIGYIRASR